MSRTLDNIGWRRFATGGPRRERESAAPQSRDISRIYESIVNKNSQPLLGYIILSAAGVQLPIPYPPEFLTEEQLTQLKDALGRWMPLDSMITDLRNWDSKLEDDLSDDWYFGAIFGLSEDLDPYASELADYFLLKCAEFDIDYDQQPEDDAFQRLVSDAALRFLSSWRDAVFREREAVIAAVRDLMSRSQ